MKHLLKMREESLFVKLQKFQKANPVHYELEIHKIKFQHQEYWLIPNFPQAKFVFLINSPTLEFVKNMPDLILDHMSVIIQLMVLEYSFRNQSVEKVRFQVKQEIQNIENWLNNTMIGRLDKLSFDFNREKIRKEVRLNLISNDKIANIIGLSVDFHLPQEIYNMLYDEMFVLSLEKKV